MMSLTNILVIYGFILLILVNQGTIVDFARKKGYEGIIPGLWGLLPALGMFLYFVSPWLALVMMIALSSLGYIYYIKRPALRNVSRIGIRSVFRVKEFIGRVLVYGQISLVAIIVIIPVVYIFGLAFSNIQSSVSTTIWPQNPTFGAFEYLIKETKFTRWYGNTLKIAVLNMVVGTVLITGASYVFARFSFKGKKAGLLTILVLQAFPSFMGLLAMYALFNRFGLLGIPTALSILYIGGSIPGNLWLIKGFLSQIPKDLDESAMIDGANKLQIFIRIILPLSVPILTFVAVSMFMGPWMDYMLPNYLLNFKPPGAPVDHDVTNQWTLAMGIFKFINDPNYIHYSAFASAALLVGLPITALYMIFQRYLIEGIMAGATKG